MHREGAEKFVFFVDERADVVMMMQVEDKIPEMARAVHDGAKFDPR